MAYRWSTLSEGVQVWSGGGRGVEGEWREGYARCEKAK